MHLFKSFLRKPPLTRAVWTGAITTALTAYGLAGFFFWFDGQLASFKAVDGLEVVARSLESRGHFAEAEAVLRELIQIKSRQVVGPLFPGGPLPREYSLDSRVDLARVLTKAGRSLACRDEYSRLLGDAGANLGSSHAYYVRLREHARTCARLPG